MVISLMSCISNMATLVVNAPDFASRAYRPSAAVLPQLISVPLGFSLVSFLGIIVSSSSNVIYGEPVWNPIDLLGKFLDNDAEGHGPSSATRFGVWYISASFILAQVRPVHIFPSYCAYMFVLPAAWHEHFGGKSRTMSMRSMSKPPPQNSISAGCDLTALLPRYIVSILVTYLPGLS